METTQPIYVTKDEDVISNQTSVNDFLTPCSHEEADTRLLVHARHAVLTGCRKITLKANDTDVVVIAIAHLANLQELGLKQLYIEFVQGSNQRLLDVNKMNVESEGNAVFPRLHRM